MKIVSARINGSINGTQLINRFNIKNEYQTYLYIQTNNAGPYGESDFLDIDLQCKHTHTFSMGNDDIQIKIH